MILRNLAITLCIPLLAHCTAPVSVHPVKPEPPAGALVTPSGTEQRLAAILQSYQKIAAGDSTAIATYNYEVARLVQNLKNDGTDPWSAPLALSGTSGIRTFKTTYPSDLNPAESTFYPADSMEFSGELSKVQSNVDGLGAPIVAAKSFAGFLPSRASIAFCGVHA